MAGESPGSVEGISELLRCYICMERLNDASICPHCSKLGCFSCIRRWVTDNRSDCPHCRAPLLLKDFIRIPLFDDLGQVLDTLQSNQRNAPSTERERARCLVHKDVHLSVYCETCKKCVCHECALWGVHKGHSIKPVEVLYQKRRENFQTELNKLKECMKEVMNHVQQTEKRMEGVRISRNKVRRDTERALEKIYGRLDEQSRATMQKLQDTKRHLKNRAVEITQVSHGLEAKISAGCISSLVNENGEMREELLQVLRRLQGASVGPDVVPCVGELVNEVVPPYDSAVFKIHPFRELQKKGEEVYSKPLQAYGMMWRLKVYPNGHREDTGNYLAVFVELTEGFDRSTSYHYCIEMLYNCSSRYPQRNYKREYASDFADGESWGYRKFYELSKLQEDNFLRDDTVVLRFSVRPPNYYQKCKDLVSYIHRLEDRETTLKQKLQTAQQQLQVLKGEQSRAMAAGSNHGRSLQQERNSHFSPHHHHHHHSQPPQPHHQHSHSAPAPTHTPNDRQHRERDEVRRATYLSASQQPLRSPKRNLHYTHSRHGETHLMPTDARRRRSHEESEHRSLANRRRSADPAVIHHCDQTRSHLPFSRGLSQSYQELRHSQDKLHYSTECHDRHQRPRGHDNTHSLVGPPFRNTLFEDSSSDNEGGGSQPHPWEALSQRITEDDRSTVRSGSSTSTIIAAHTNGRSQEQFGEEDQSEMFHYYDHSTFEQDMMPPPIVRQEFPHSQQSQGLSQPSPPRSKHGKMRMSLTDLSSLTSSATNLAHSQFLSQSVAEMPHYTHRDAHSSRVVDPRLSNSRQPSSHSHSHLNRSEPFLNADGPPGLLGVMAAALTNLKEEAESKSPQPRQTYSKSQTVGRRQKGTSGMGYGKLGRPRHKTMERSSSHKPSIPEQTREGGEQEQEKEKTTPTSVPGTLATGSKSSSSSSLSQLDLI